MTASYQQLRTAVHHRRAFTLVELLIDAIQRYHIQHDAFPGLLPGEQQPNEKAFVSQLTCYTDAAGNVSEQCDRSKWPYGPYLARGIPPNPLRGTNRVKVVVPEDGDAKLSRSVTVTDAKSLDPDIFTEKYGWLYAPDTGEFVPNDEELFK